MTALLAAAAAAAPAEPTVIAATPVFSEFIEVTMPRGFVPGSESRTPGHYLQEWVPRGETVEHWSQMITLTGLERGAQAADAPRAFAAYLARGYRNACPESYAVREVGATEVDGHPAFAALMSCGRVTRDGDTHYETMYVIAIRGRADLYTLQWAERGPPSDGPLALDANAWVARIAALDPVRLCARSEAAAGTLPHCGARR